MTPAEVAEATKLLKRLDALRSLLGSTSNTGPDALGIMFLIVGYDGDDWATRPGPEIILPESMIRDFAANVEGEIVGRLDQLGVEVPER